MIHIVHIIPSLGFGGAERILTLLINHSDKRAFRHSIIVFDKNTPLRSELPPEIEVRVVEKRGRVSLHLFHDLKLALQELQPDIVQTHLSGGDIWGRIAAKRLKLPVVSRQANLTRDLSFTKRMILRLLCNTADEYIACSNAVKQSVIQTYGIKTERITVIHNAIETARFTALPLPIFAAPVKLLVVGRLTYQKGQDVLLKALHQVTELPWRLTIVGEGATRPELQKLVEHLALPGQVEFLPPVAAIDSVYAKHDMVIMPSRYEGFGLAALEAMAAGRPVIASAVDGLCEFIRDGETGYLVPKEDHKALAEKIRWCLSNPDKCIEVGKRAREYAAAHFGVEKMVMKYEEVYRNVVHS